MMGFLLIPPSLLLAAGLMCLLKPEWIANYFRAFARSIRNSEGDKAIRTKRQEEEQTTARDTSIKLLEIVLAVLGILFLVRVLPFLTQGSGAG